MDGGFDGGFRETEHMMLQRFVESVLEAFGRGQIDRNRATALLAHATLSAADDRTGEFRRLIARDPDEALEALPGPGDGPGAGPEGGAPRARTRH